MHAKTVQQIDGSHLQEIGPGFWNIILVVRPGESEARGVNLPRGGGPKDFWNRIKSISVTEIAREANRPLSVALVGSPEVRQAATNALYEVVEEHASSPRALPGSPYLQGFDSMSEEAGFPRDPGLFDFVIDVGGGREGAPAGNVIYSLQDLGGWGPTLERILQDRPELALPLARNFPVFRRRVGQQIINQTATTNAQFSLLTGVVSAFPIFELLLPANAFSDILVLTKNQIMMTLRLAAAYGLEVNYRSRMKELGPILVNAFGWRAVARELVGVVPAVGFLFRAMISYAGTVTVGKAAQLYYETGETITRSQAQRLYKDAYAASRARVRSLAASLKSGRGGGARRQTRAALPSSETVEPLSSPTNSEKAETESRG